MDVLTLVWDFAPAIKIKLLLLAVAAQIVTTIYSYSKMSDARRKARKENRIVPNDYKALGVEDEDLRVFTRAVANQFEMPVLFYVLVLAILFAGSASWITVALAWIYVILRFVHLREMITDNRVLLRRTIFIRSTQTLLLLLVEFVVAILFWVQVSS